MDLEFAGCFVGRIADEDRKVNDVIVIGVRCGGARSQALTALR